MSTIRQRKPSPKSKQAPVTVPQSPKKPEYKKFDDLTACERFTRNMSCRKEERPRRAGGAAFNQNVTTVSLKPFSIFWTFCLVVFLTPVFICTPQPLYDVNNPNGDSTPSFDSVARSFSDIGLSLRRTTYATLPHALTEALPLPVAQWLNVPLSHRSLSPGDEFYCPSKSITSPSLPLPACSPVCNTMYWLRGSVTAAAKKVAFVITDGLQNLAFAFKLKVNTEIVTSDYPSWIVFRLGQPVISFFHSAFTSLMPPEKKVLMTATAFLQTSTMRAVAKLHVPDVIYSLTGGDTLAYVHIDDIARSTCASKPHLQRLMRTAAVLGLFFENDRNEWRLSAQSDLLREDHPRTLKAAALMMGAEQYVAQSSLYQSVQSGEPAFSEIYGDFWAYQDHAQAELKQFEFSSGLNNNHFTGSCVPFVPRGLAEVNKLNAERLASATETLKNTDKTDVAEVARITASTIPTYPYQLQHPGEGLASASVLANPSEDLPKESVDAVRALASPQLNNVRVPVMLASSEFNRGMVALASSVAKMVAQDGNFGEFDTVVDIAGGHGHLLNEIMKLHPHISTGIVFDQPNVYDDSHTLSEIQNSANVMFAVRQGYTEEFTQYVSQHGGMTAANSPSMSQLNLDLSNNLCRLSPSPSLPLSKRPIASFSNNDIALPNDLNFNAHNCHRNPRAKTLVSQGYSNNYFNDEDVKLCPSLYITTGNFFKAETMPRAHEYSTHVLKHKLEQILSRLSNGNTKDADLTIRDGQHALKLRHNAAYVMMQIVHDWSDKDSVRILKEVREAMISTPTVTEKELCRSDGQIDVTMCEGDRVGSVQSIDCPRVEVEMTSKLYLVDRIITKGNLVDTMGSNLADVLMMNNFHDARERDVAGMKAILEEAGFRLLRVLPTRSMMSVVEAEPIQ